MQRPLPPPATTTPATATATIGLSPPVVDQRVLYERRRSVLKSLPGPWRRH
jgi:hypothetical protein